MSTIPIADIAAPGDGVDSGAGLLQANSSGPEERKNSLEPAKVSELFSIYSFETQLSQLKNIRHCEVVYLPPHNFVFVVLYQNFTYVCRGNTGIVW